jgi:hypothetical protein
MSDPLQSIEDTLLPDTLEDKPNTPLFVVSKHSKNDLKCDNGNKLKVQNLWKFYFCMHEN